MTLVQTINEKVVAEIDRGHEETAMNGYQDNWHGAPRLGPGTSDDAKGAAALGVAEAKVNGVEPNMKTRAPTKGSWLRGWTLHL